MKNQLATSNRFYNRFVGENPSIEWADRVQDASSPLSLSIKCRTVSHSDEWVTITLTQTANNYLQKCYPADLVTETSDESRSND